MIRSLALTASFCLCVGAPALAQHPANHAQGRPHDPAAHHYPMDAKQHDAMHALVHGRWIGASSFPGEIAPKLDVAVATDKAGKLTLKMKADEPIRVGTASKIALEGNTLHWTQEVAGVSCKATAVVSPATAQASETMKGSMACEQGEIAFALQKTKG